jgi:hypothetical protein
MIPIQKTHFEYQERYNPNLGILSPRDPFTESIVFYVLLLKKTKKIWYPLSSRSIYREYCLLGLVVGKD